METLTLHDRLKSVAGEQTYRSIAQLTHTHPETVRRYMQGQAPSVEFLSELCHALSINADWLLTGRGPARADQVTAHALRHANPSELHAAIANTISSLVDRVDRLETYCQTLETKLRAKGADTSAPAGIPSKQHEQEPEIVTRARRVADAVAKRPRDDAD